LYLNQVNYGGMAYGVEAAAETYFGKSAGDLILPECACWPDCRKRRGFTIRSRTPDLAKQRQQIVLGLMEQTGTLPASSASQRRPRRSATTQPLPIEAPHFVWLIKDQLEALFASGRLNPNQSLVVRTTLDLNDQHTAEQIMARRLQAFKPKAGEINHNVNNAPW